jgi:hypothetical protein
VKKIAILLALSMTGASVAMAQSTTATAPTDVAAGANTTTGSASDLQKPDETMKDQSQEITNARMRAEAGSRSKYSVKANLSYSGGSVERPLERVRPNYRAGVAADAATTLGGTMAVAYRASDKLTARFGTGLSMRTPFHNKDKEVASNQYEKTGAKVIDVATPYLEASSAFRLGNLMLMPSATVSYFSKQIDRDVYKKDAGVDADLTAVYEITGSGWQPGLTTAVYNTFYQDAKQDFDRIGDRNARDDYGIGFYPFVEYQFNDRYSFRTLIGISYTHVRSEDADTFIKDKVYQSAGIGIALTKEVYIYPNVQFLPDEMRPAQTNVGLSTTMSVF